MKITVIVAKTEDETPWILAAWDEYMIDANYKGFCDVLKCHQETLPGTDVRTALIEVPEEFLESIFKPVKVKGVPATE